MRFLKFNSLLLLVQIWNDLTRWLVLYNSWIALISCWWFGFFFPFLFFPPHMNVFLHRLPACSHWVALCANAKISETLTAAWKSDQVNKEPQAWPCFPEPTWGQHAALANRQDKGAHAQAASSPLLLLQVPKGKELAKIYFLSDNYNHLLNMSYVPDPVWNILHADFHPSFQMRKRRFRDSEQPDQSHTSQKENCNWGWRFSIIKSD